MDTKELRALMEAYAAVYENQQQLDEGLDMKTFKANRQKAQRSAASADAKKRGHVDKFTGKSYGTAEASSRRKGIHTPAKKPSRDAARDAAGGETGHGGALRAKKVRKAKAMGELGEGVDLFDVVLEFLCVEGYAETLEEAEWLMSNVIDEEAIDIILGEAQVANRDPDKYEREQEKKYAPVRGEKTPMPPRGNKRREDFEKWYAKNVR